MSFAEQFKSNFYSRMLQPNHPATVPRDRASSLLRIFEILDKRKQTGQDYFRILETGTTRSDHGHLCFGDDGCATYIFDKFVNHYDGEVLSVDISEKNCVYSNSLTSEKTKVHCGDSVDFLWSLPPNIKIDFLYLDSFDFIAENPYPSMLHHVKELCAVMKNIHPKTLIVVDDHNISDNTALPEGKMGKGTYVKSFMDDIGAELLFEGYQVGWILGE
jgi:hypothetical protein